MADLLKTIGPGWSPGPGERAREIEAQERLVGEILDIMDEVEEWELEVCAERLRQETVQ
jgi:hypothetical protein